MTLKFQNKNAAPAAVPSLAGSAPRFTVREATLCGELRVSKDELRRRRQYFLTAGQHWDYVDKRVLLSAVGAEILRGTRAALVPADAATADSVLPQAKKNRAAIALLAEKNPAPVEFAGELLVWAIPSRNERLVIGYLPGTDPGNPLNLVSVLVRSNRNFLRGMKVPGPGRQVNRTGENSYELLGECPRFRGRW